MAFGIDDIVESALGPWGLVLGLGVGALVSRRERLIPLVASSAGAGKARFESLSAAGAERARAGRARFESLGAAGAERARGGLGKLAPMAAMAGGGVAAAGHIAGQARNLNLKDTGQALLLGVTRSWSDLYAEAKAEFEASLPASTGAAWADGERVDDIVQAEDGQRDARGRFIKKSAN
ncbi:MAG: hypothetical protein ACKVVP_16420 [Chloroflexota bacterium]